MPFSSDSDVFNFCPSWSYFILSLTWYVNWLRCWVSAHGQSILQPVLDNNSVDTIRSFPWQLYGLLWDVFPTPQSSWQPYYFLEISGPKIPPNGERSRQQTFSIVASRWWNWLSVSPCLLQNSGGKNNYFNVPLDQIICRYPPFICINVMIFTILMEFYPCFVVHLPDS